jgi:Lrp/AsnC family transcriptional regulator for asnA, asnC and gidA
MALIDKTDSRILRILLSESRFSFTELAEQCGISLTSVIRRYERLKKIGIIKGEHMFLNPLSLGFDSIAEIGIHTDVADKEKVSQLLKSRLSVDAHSWIGRYELFGTLRAKKLSELNELVKKADVKPYVKQVDVLILADLWNNPWHPENFIIEPYERDDKIIFPERATGRDYVELDEIDKGIAQALGKNSRIAFSELAKKFSISTANVIRRYNSLRKNNVINLSSISIDVSKIGYNAIIDSFLRVTDKGAIAETETQLLQIPNSVFCAKYIVGPYDMRVATLASGFQDFFTVRDQVLSIKNIRKAEFHLGNIECAGPWPADFLAGRILPDPKE